MLFNNSQSNESKKIIKSKVGGQALIEGVMMRGTDKAAMACRLPNGSIDVEDWTVRGGKKAPWYTKAPFIRGSINFVTSMVDGYKCLTKSAEKQGDFEDEEMSPFEEKLMKIFGDKLMPIISIISIILGVGVSFLLFMYLPMFITRLFSGLITSPILKTLIEGILKIALFITYLAVVSKLKDIQRTFEYHGAEHKTIACHESGDELTVENVRKYTRFHPRCGTSFLLIVLVVSILVFSVVTWETMLVRITLKILLLPVVTGIAYEIIKLAGRFDNIVTRAISAPGMALQRLTTREPDDKQIEVAIAALKPCIPNEEIR